MASFQIAYCIFKQVLEFLKRPRGCNFNIAVAKDAQFTIKETYEIVCKFFNCGVISSNVNEKDFNIIIQEGVHIDCRIKDEDGSLDVTLLCCELVD